GEYIADRYSPDILTESIKSPLVGIPSINQALAQKGFSENFEDIYSNWLIANVVNDISLGDKFGLSRDDLDIFKVTPNNIFLNVSDGANITTSDNFKDWQGKWYDIIQFGAGNNRFLEIEFTSPSLTSFYISYVIFNSDGTIRSAIFKPGPQTDTLTVGGIGSEVTRVIFMPVKKDRLKGFTAEESTVSLTSNIKRVASSTNEMAVPEEPEVTPDILSPILNLPDGSLIRAEGDTKVYVINGSWRRHIPSPRVFDFYPHLGFDKVKVVSRAEADQYQDSNLIRFDERVYSLESGQRRWLNISGEQFSASSRAWDAVFRVNELELNFYPVGSNITQ
ncbi:MAG: hypothetical protein WED06_02925, partial [Candidatus Paceibacterota bacterium]